MKFYDDLVGFARRQWHKARSSGDDDRIKKSRRFVKMAERVAEEKRARVWAERCKNNWVIK